MMLLASLVAPCFLGPTVEWAALLAGVSLGVRRGWWWTCFFVIWLGAVLGSVPSCEAIGAMSPVGALIFGWVPAAIVTLFARPLWGLLVPWVQAISRVVRGRAGA